MNAREETSNLQTASCQHESAAVKDSAVNDGAMPGGKDPGADRAPAPQRRQLARWQVLLVSGIASLVVAGALAAAHWWWGIFYGTRSFLEFFPSGAVLAEVTVRRERAHRVDPTLWGGAAPRNKHWYWVAEFRGYHESTKKLAAHGFFRPFPVLSGDPKVDQAKQPWKGQVYEGLWRSYYENGTLASEGPYVAAERSGRWTTWHENGKLQMRGEYVRRQRQGLWEIYDQQGVLRAHAEFKNDMRDGLETVFDSKGNRTATIEWKDNTEDGLRTMFHPDSKIVHSTWYFSHGKLFGPHQQFDAAGNLVMEGNYEFDLKHGKWVRYYPNGRKHSVQTYIQDRLHGHETIWNVDGTVKSDGEYRDERQSGRWVTYGPKGEKQAEGDYIDGKRHGPWKHWDADGKVTLVTWDMGNVVEPSKPAP